MENIETFHRFLQEGIEPEQRAGGLHAILQEALSLPNDPPSFVEYTTERDPGKTPTYCIENKLTYSVGLSVTMETKARKEIFFADLPIMTPRGTFILEGEERSITAQSSTRSGLYFSRKGANVSAHLIFSASPEHAMGIAELTITKHKRSGLSLHLETDWELDAFFSGVSKKRDIPSKFPERKELRDWLREHLRQTPLCWHRTKKDIGALEDALYNISCELQFTQERAYLRLEKLPENLCLPFDVRDTTGAIIAPAQRPLKEHIAAIMQAGINEVLLSTESLPQFALLEDAINPETGEVYILAGEHFTAAQLRRATHRESQRCKALYQKDKERKDLVEDWGLVRLRMLYEYQEESFDMLSRYAEHSHDSRIALALRLLEALSLTDRLFLERPEDELFDVTEVYAQQLWFALQPLRHAILHGLSSPEVASGTQALQRTLLSALYEHSHR